MADARVSDDGRVVSVRVPLTVRKRGGRKVVIGPDGASLSPSSAQPDSALVKALVRAFRWRKLLETGVYATVEEIARAEKINASYVSRVLRLTLLAPGIVEPIMNGRQPAMLQLRNLLKRLPSEWIAQQSAFNVELGIKMSEL